MRIIIIILLITTYFGHNGPLGTKPLLSISGYQIQSAEWWISNVPQALKEVSVFLTSTFTLKWPPERAEVEKSIDECNGIIKKFVRLSSSFYVMLTVLYDSNTYILSVPLHVSLAFAFIVKQQWCQEILILNKDKWWNFQTHFINPLWKEENMSFPWLWSTNTALSKSGVDST